MEGKCVVFFEDPFWVAVFERSDETGYAVARYVFGAEPSEAELYQFACEQYLQLAFSAPVAGETIVIGQAGYKRRQREARRMVEQPGAGTFAQRAIQAERERQKVARHAVNRHEQEAMEQQKFQMKQEKKKQKHRGR